MQKTGQENTIKIQGTPCYKITLFGETFVMEYDDLEELYQKIGQILGKDVSISVKDSEVNENVRKTVEEFLRGWKESQKDKTPYEPNPWNPVYPYYGPTHLYDPFCTKLNPLNWQVTSATTGDFSDNTNDDNSAERGYN